MLGKEIHACAITNVLNAADRKSTRLNSSHANISYAVFCVKKKKHRNDREAFNGLVPGCDNGNNSRRRPRYGIESHVALYRLDGYTLLGNLMPADSDRVVPD